MRDGEGGEARSLETIAARLYAAAGDSDIEDAARDAIAALGDTEPELRAMALREIAALGIFLTHRLDALELGLADEAVRVRRSAAALLEPLRPELVSHFRRRGHTDQLTRVLHLLIKGLRDADPGVRDHSAAAFVTLDHALEGALRGLCREHAEALGLDLPALPDGTPSLETVQRVCHEARQGAPAERIWLLAELVARCLDAGRTGRRLELLLRALGRTAPLALVALAQSGVANATRALTTLERDDTGTIPDYLVEALAGRLGDPQQPEYAQAARLACHALGRRAPLPPPLAAALARMPQTPPRVAAVRG